MVKFLLLFSAVAVAAVVYPRYAEHSDDVCGALGKRLGSLLPGEHSGSPQAVIGPKLIDLANATMQARFPQVPVTIRCTVAYWTLVADPDAAETAKRLLSVMPSGSPPK